MSDKNFSISIRFDAKTGKVVGQINDVSDALTKTGTASEKSMQTLAKSSQNAGTTLEDLSRKAHAYFFGWQAFQTAGAILKTADQVAQLDQRVKTATRATGDYATVSARLYQIAQQTGTALDSNVALFQSLARVAPEIGATNGQMLALTKTLQQLGRIGGSSQEQMSNAMLQFGQAMAGGVLRAEEFNSIVENTPEVANRIAQGMDLTVGQLRMAVLAGGVLSKDVFDALLKQTAEINAQAAEAAMNMSVGWRMLSTSAANALSTINSGLGDGIGGVTGLNERLGRTVSVTELLDKIFERTTELERVDREILALKNSINQGVSIFGNTTTDILRQQRELKQLEQERLAILGVVNKLTAGSVGLDLAAEYDAQQKAIYGVFETKEYMQAEEKAWIEALKAYHGEYASELKAQADEQKQAARANADYQAEQEKRWRADIIAFDREYQDELTRQWQDAQTYRQNTINALWDADNRDFDKMDAQDNDRAALVADIEQMALSVDSIGDAWMRTGDRASEAIGAMSKTFADYQKQYKAAGNDQAKIDKLRFDNLNRLSKGFIDLAQYKASEAKLDEKQAALDEQKGENQIALYHGLAGAMVGAFEQGSTAAQAFSVIQQGLALYDGIRAVINAWAAPWPLNLAMVPLTIANVAALLGQMGQTISASSSANVAPKTANGMTAEQNIAFIDASYQPVIDRLDRQISLLESIDRQGSASALKVDSAALIFEKEYKTLVQQALATGTLSARRDNIQPEVRAAYPAMADALGFDFFKNTSSSVWQVDTQSLSDGFNYLKLISSEFSVMVSFIQDAGWKKSGMSPGEFGVLQQGKLISEFQGLLSDFSGAVIESMTELRDAGKRFEGFYDDITGTTYYATLRLDKAYADVKALSNGASVADYLADQVSRIDDLSAFFTNSVFETLLSQDKADAVKQLDILDALTAKTGLTFEQGAREALDYLESIELVAESMSSIRKEAQALNDRLLELQNPAEYENLLRQNQLAALDESNRAIQQHIWSIEDHARAAESFASLVSSFASYAQALGTDQASVITQKKADLKNVYDAEVVALNALINSSNEAIASTKTLSSQLSSAFDTIYSTVAIVTLDRYRAAQAELLDYANRGLLPLGQDLSRLLGVIKSNSTDNYTTREAYMRDQAITVNALSQLNGIADTQLSAEEQALAAQKDQTKALKSALDHQIKQIDLAVLLDNQASALVDVTRDVADYIKAGFDQLDKNIDNIIDWNEFSSAFSGLATETTLQSVFAALDLNLDGLVTGVEVILSALAGSHYSAQDITDYISAIDAQSGAGLSTQDILSIYQTMQDTQTTAAQVAAAYGMSEQQVVDIIVGANQEKSLKTATGATSTTAITNAEIQAYIGTMSQRWDTNQDGIVDKWAAQEIAHAGQHFGVSMTRLETAMGWQPGVVKDTLDYWGIPAFASGGVHSGGLRLVGEQGPELEFTGPSRIFSNSDTLKMLDNTRLESLIEKLINRIEQLEEQAARTAVATQDSAELLNRFSRGLPTYNIEVQ
ncbi:MAG: tape measure protein [Thiomicrospira sp.]